MTGTTHSTKDHTPALSRPFWMRHQLLMLLIGSITAALLLTVVSVFIYTQSGAAQLDLSRPGYRAVSDKVEYGPDMDTYDSTGPVTADSLKDFTTLYTEQSEKAKAVDAFSGDPLNPEVLGFGSSSQ